MTFLPFPSLTTEASTFAPSTVGVPTLTVSPTTKSTLSNVTLAPTSASSYSTLITSPSLTLYCLPRVGILADITGPPIIKSRQLW